MLVLITTKNNNSEVTKMSISAQLELQLCVLIFFYIEFEYCYKVSVDFFLDKSMSFHRTSSLSVLNFIYIISVLDA